MLLTTDIDVTRTNEMIKAFYAIVASLHRTKSNKIRGLANAIKKALNNPDIVIRTKKDKAVTEDMILVSGMYYPCEDQDNAPPIHLTLNYCPSAPIVKENLDIEWISVEVVETIVHEYRHRLQYRNRNYAAPTVFCSVHEDFLIKEDQEYLGTEDEIDAYSHSIAAEIYLRDQLKITDQETIAKDLHVIPEYKYYTNAFGDDHPIIKDLRLKVDNLLKSMYNSENSLLAELDIALTS